MKLSNGIHLCAARNTYAKREINGVAVHLRPAILVLRKSPPQSHYFRDDTFVNLRFDRAKSDPTDIQTRKNLCRKALGRLLNSVCAPRKHGDHGDK